MKTVLVLYLWFACLLPTLLSADVAPPVSEGVTISERTAGDETKFYVVSISLPAGSASVSHARLEFRADVSATNLNGFVDPAPILDIYVLNQSLTGDPDASKFAATRIPMSRPVAAGENRLIKIDVTEYVQMIVTDPSKNHGIVLGSLTGDKLGVFHVREDGFGDGVEAQLVIVE